MIIVERATEDDYSDIIDIDIAFLGDDRRRPYLTRAIMNREMVVARLAAQRVGFAIANRAFFERYFVAAIVVHPDYRRQGIARALLRYVEKTCPDRRIFASASDSNMVGRRMLATLGYTEAGHLDYINDNERELIYVKFLNLK